MPQHVTMELVKIDADKARAFLALNSANRPLSRSRVRILARKMEAGEWMLTGQAHVIIGSDGVLLNGQHTMHAVVEANAVIETIVVRGVEPEAFGKIDIGWKRTLGNILSVAGTANSNCLAAVLRLTEAYDSLRHGERGWTFRAQLDADELVPLFEIDPDRLSESATFGKRLEKSATRTGVNIPGSVSGTFRYVAVREGHDPESVGRFAHRVANDTDHAPNDPALTLRRWILARKGITVNNSSDRGLHLLSAWIKAFLAAERGATLQKVYAWTRESPDYPRL